MTAFADRGAGRNGSHSADRHPPPRRACSTSSSKARAARARRLHANSYADPTIPGYEGDRALRAPRHRRHFLRAALRRPLFPDPAPRRANPGSSAIRSARRPRPAFSGSAIDHAVASNGSRYAVARNAFAYREKVVDNCTCNGRDAYGLVTLNVDRRSVPALRRHRRHQRGLCRLQRQRPRATPSSRRSSPIPDCRRSPAAAGADPDHADNATPIPPEAIRRRRRRRARWPRPPRSARPLTSDQVTRHFLADRQRRRQPRQLDAEQHDQPRHAVVLRRVDDEVERRLARPADLGPDAGIVRDQRVVRQPRPEFADARVERSPRGRIDVVVLASIHSTSGPKRMRPARSSTTWMPSPPGIGVG